MAATNGSLAQSVEQLAFNQLVVGSNPTRPTIFTRNPPQWRVFAFSPAQTSSRLGRNLASRADDVKLNQLAPGAWHNLV